MGKAKVTIKDVAKEAGVSIATVSNALNGVDVLHPKTKKKVMDAVEKLHYVPNLNGRYLKAGESKIIGLFTNCITGSYFGTLMNAMSRQCEQRGYGLNIFVTEDKQLIMGNIVGRRIDGAVIFEDNVVREEDIAEFEKADNAVVFIDRVVKDRRIASVLFDSYKNAYEATKYLISLGHKKIAFLESVENVLDSRERKRGYMAALTECGLEKDGLLIPGGFAEEYTYREIESFIQQQPENMPEAILAGNDESAIGCMKALKKAGYRVPEDVSVMGFDDIEIAQYFTPRLTTVSNPIVSQGIMIIDTLIDMLQDKEEGSVKYIDGKLIIRDSCAIRQDR